MNKFKMQLFKDSFKYGRKRKQTTKNIAVAAFAIFASTIIASLIGTMFGYSPFETIKTLFSAALIIEPDKFAYMLCVFALSAFAFSFAFKAGIFNIGISGQMYGAGVVLLVVTTALKNVYFPPFVGQLFSLVIAMSVGSSIALCVGAMERYLKVNAVVSSIILNWIILLIGFFIIGAWYSNNEDYSQMTASTDIPSQFTLAGGAIAGWIPALIIVVIIAIILLVLSKYTVFGHKIQSTGLSIEGSKYAGYNVNLIKLSTFGISGALSGILAVVLYTSKTPNIPATILSVIVPVEGFNGIAVGLIAGNNPIGIIGVSAIIGLFKTSSSFLPMSPVFNDVIIGLLMLGASLTVVLHNYKPWIFVLKKKYASDIANPYNIFENSTDSIISKYKSIYSVYKKQQKADQQNLPQLIDEKSKYTSIDQILNDYLNEINKAKNAYYEAAIHEWMILKLKPQKYISLNNKKIVTDYDEKLTKYVSKQKSKIESNSEFVSKNVSISAKARVIYKNLKNNISKEQAKILSILQSNKYVSKDYIKSICGFSIEQDLQSLIIDNYVEYKIENGIYYYTYSSNSPMFYAIKEDNTLFNKFLLNNNENRLRNIAISINQNSVWKEKAIANNEKKYAKNFNTYNSNKQLEELSFKMELPQDRVMNNSKTSKINIHTKNPNHMSDDLLNSELNKTMFNLALDFNNGDHITIDLLKVRDQKVTAQVIHHNYKKLIKISNQAKQMIEKNIIEDGTRKELFAILNDYKNEIIKNGGRLC